MEDTKTNKIESNQNSRTSNEPQDESKIDILNTIIRGKKNNPNGENNYEEGANYNDLENKVYEENADYDENENFDDNENLDENENFEGDENFEDNENFDENEDLEENAYCEDDEVVFDSDNEANLGIDDDASCSIYMYSSLKKIVNTYSAFMYESPAYLSPTGFINVSLPTYFLPLSLQAVYGFSTSQNILNIVIELDNEDWTKPPIRIDIQHPTLQSHFVGRSLIMNVVKDFFSKDYKPRLFYRSESYLLHPTGRADEYKLSVLIGEAFEEKSAERALIICNNNIEQAREFLCTGLMPPHDSILSIDFSACPLLFLILEFADCFLNLQDHCCICGHKTEPGLKPSICSDKLCAFRLDEIGLGTSVVQEIQRDPLAADLMVSLFSSAMNTEFLTPAPTDSRNDYGSLIQKFPSMERMKSYQTDSQLAQSIGSLAFDLLRWILLSNRSQLISLPKQFQLSQFPNTFQFMTLISTPEAEKKFKELKTNYGSMFLWHGSNGVRWHSIIRNGLKNCSGTKLQANGAALGSGIYMARSSNTSWGYSMPAKNYYSKSSLGKNLHIIGLCEVAEVTNRKCGHDYLKDHGWAHTLGLEEACVVRFLFVQQGYGGNESFGDVPFTVDVAKNPPRKVPTLRDMLNYMAGHD